MTIYYSNTTKGFYDTEIIKYDVLPEDIIEITQEQHEYFLNELNANNKVITINSNNEFELIERTYSWQEIRAIRNIMIINTDYTQLPDFPEAKKQEWATYRQLLRDIPQTYSNAQDVIWPTKPEN